MRLLSDVSAIAAIWAQSFQYAFGFTSVRSKLPATSAFLKSINLGDGCENA